MGESHVEGSRGGREHRGLRERCGEAGDPMRNAAPSGWAWRNMGGRCGQCDEGAGQGEGRRGVRVTRRTR